MKIYNSLTRKIEEFKPIREGQVGVYTCGPTVYDTATIGNFRTYVISDILVRVFKYLGYKVDYVMNLTDVGHLTGDNEGDPDTGVDRMEKGAKREGEDAYSIASRYSSEFVRHMELIGMVRPKHLVRATDHIQEQIDLVSRLEKKGFTYTISDGVYFDTKEYENKGNVYGELSTLDKIVEGARVAKNEEKRDRRDFALWKFSPEGAKRHMEWDSPWGVGFPGWHIECSAMSMKYLGPQFDVHVGGEDLRSTHHPNEIAQSEGATGKRPFVKYWVHSSHLLVDGGRMGKSLGNAYTIPELEDKGYSASSLRYLYLTGHYRKQLNFTFESLSSASSALSKLSNLYKEYGENQDRVSLSPEKMEKIDSYREEFRNAVSQDLDMPSALSVVWKVVKSNIPSTDKKDLLDDFDKVLGLNLSEIALSSKEVPSEVKELLSKRDALRGQGKWDEADMVRSDIEKMGYTVQDTPDGSSVI